MNKGNTSAVAVDTIRVLAEFDLQFHDFLTNFLVAATIIIY